MTIASAPRTRWAEAVARLSSRGARRWYGGAGFGLVYQAIQVVSIWAFPGGTLAVKVIATALLAVLYAAYVVLPPLVWPESARVRIGAIVVYWAATCLEFALIGATTIWIWTLIVVLIGFTWLPRAAGAILLGAIVLAQVLVAWVVGWADSVAYAPWVTLSVGVAMNGFGALVQRNAQLRQAQEEVARLAVNEERARLARDLHDSLGHSLTVVAVKSELARKLVSRDPVKAEAEIADIERLARDGLRDLRDAVAGYRAADLGAELASARLALDAAGISGHLPTGVEGVRPDLLGLFGWAVREGVTNVLRHSGARTCWVELDAASVTIRDDGAGREPTTPARTAGAASGNGLRGLRERAAAVGATVTSGPRVGGGFELRVIA